MIVAVFDTNIILQGILSEGGPADECLRFVFQGKVRLITTDAVLGEIEDVISRPKLVSKYPQLRTERPNQIIAKIRSEAAFVSQPPNIYRFERDPKDEIFINLAIAANAEYLVSRDNDLLDLRLDEEFTSSFPDLKIVSPFDFLQAVRAK